MARSQLLPCLVVGALATFACQKKDAPPSTDPSTATSDNIAAADKPDFKHPQCKSWADLDPSTLPALPPGEYVPTMDTVWSTLLAKHYDVTLSCTDWPAIRAWYGEQVAAASSEDDAAKLINGMLQELGQSHVAFVPGSKRSHGEARSNTGGGPAMVPVQVRWIDGAAVIVDAKRYGLDSGLPAGATVLAVDDSKVSDLDEGLQARHAGEIEHAFMIRRFVGGWLTCPTGASKSIEFVPAGGGEPQTKTVPCVEPKLETTTFGNLTSPTTVEARFIEGTKTGYIAFNIWLMPSMPKIEAGLKTMRDEGMTSLIIDLRGNPGGLGMMVIPLARQLLTEDVNLGIMHMREGQQEFNVTGQADAFTGDVAVLIDEGSASTSEIFGQSMQDIGRVKVFGASRSPGAALPSLIEELPGGSVLQYVIADYQSPKGISVEGKGVQPDTVIPETAADFAAGKDPVLDAAIAALSSN